MNAKYFVLPLAILLVFSFGGCSKSVSTEQTPAKNTIDTQTQSPSSKKFSFELSDKKLLFSGGYADPSVVRLKDGSLIMYVNTFGSKGSGNLIYTSSDGENWKKLTSKAPGSATARGFVTDAGVRLYYPTQVPISPKDPPSQILSAFATDGINFKTDPGIRVKPTENYTIEGPFVIQLADGTYRMYFDEFKADSPNERKDGKIFGASSKDGLNWERDKKPSIESDQTVEKIPANWPQALRPFVLARPNGGYVMFYNSHSKFFIAYSDDGYTWEKYGGLGIKGADIDGFYQNNGLLRVYFGDFSEATSGVVYTAVLKETEKAGAMETAGESELPQKEPPVGNKPAPPPECVGKKATDTDLPRSCELYFSLK